MIEVRIDIYGNICADEPDDALGWHFGIIDEYGNVLHRLNTVTYARADDAEAAMHAWADERKHTLRNEDAWSRLSDYKEVCAGNLL